MGIKKNNMMQEFILLPYDKKIGYLLNIFDIAKGRYQVYMDLYNMLSMKVNFDEKDLDLIFSDICDILEFVDEDEKIKQLENLQKVRQKAKQMKNQEESEKENLDNFFDKI